MSNKTFKLAVFDFDNTLINCNVYQEMDSIEINKPENLVEITNKYGWIARMNLLFKVNFITEARVKPLLDSIKIDDSMKHVLKSLHENSYKIIIISDNNSVFIEHILENEGLLKYIDKVYTNPGNYDAGYLRINGLNEEIHKERDKKPFECNLKPNKCEPNICKRCVLDYHVKNNNGNMQTHIIYCGDGKNDFCPVYLLNENDVFCVRRGFALESLLENSNNLSQVKAKLVYWATSDELNDEFEKYYM